MPMDILSPSETAVETDGLLYVDGVCIGPFMSVMVTDAPTVSLSKDDVSALIFDWKTGTRKKQALLWGEKE